MRSSREVDDQADIPDWLIPDAVWEFVGFGRPAKELPVPAPPMRQPDIRLET